MKKIIFTILLLMSLSTFAWDSTGHRLIAEIAYEHLTDSARNKVDQLTQVMDPNYPAFSRFLFASVWPDQIKNDGVTAFNAWHFVNYPFSSDGTPILPPQPENVVWAIQQSEQVLLNPNSTQYEKAVFLRFLLHFVGDAHQPLHCAEQYSRQFPRGDNSGNAFTIVNSYAINLHSFWDEGLGLFRQYGKNYPLTNKEVRQLAKKIQQDYSENTLRKQIADENSQDWAKESFSIATNFAYNLQENSVPDSRYVNQGQKIVEQQIALAGYRLADILNRIF